MSKFFQQGERLRQERERLRLSQTALAEIGDVGRKSQFNYESGENAPDGAYLTAIAAAGADVLYILTGERSGAALKPDEAALLDDYRNSPEEGKDAIKRTALALARHKRHGHTAAGGDPHFVVHGNVGNQIEHNAAEITIHMGGEHGEK